MVAFCIYRRDYIVYGYKFPYDSGIDWYSDEFSPMVEGSVGEEFSLIVDFMSGGYVVFGLVLLSGGDSYDGWDFVDLNFGSLDSEKVKSRYKQLFGLGVDVDDPSLFIFSNFS